MMGSGGLGEKLKVETKEDAYGKGQEIEFATSWVEDLGPLGLLFLLFRLPARFGMFLGGPPRSGGEGDVRHGR